MGKFSALTIAALMLSINAFAAEPAPSTTLNKSLSQESKIMPKAHQSFRDCCLKSMKPNFYALPKKGKHQKPYSSGAATLE